jgi:hypothetical protein
MTPFLRAGAALLLLTAPLSLRADERFADSSIEVGFERLWATAPWEPALFNGLVINYYPAQYFYIGTNQSSLTWKATSEYRPDFHFGLIFPFMEHVSIEATLGMDFFTAVLIALAVFGDNDSLSYKFVGSFYSPYFTFATALRIDYEMFALKLISQIQFGGYYLSETTVFNASLWLGLGATVRFAF